MLYPFEVECDKSQIDAIHATTLSRTALQLAAKKDGATIMELVDTRLKAERPRQSWSYVGGHTPVPDEILQIAELAKTLLRFYHLPG